MGFRKKNDRSNEGQESSVPINIFNSHWRFSRKGFEISIMVVNIAFSTLIIPFILFIDNKIHIELSTVQNLVQVSVALGSLCIAIPLFLRDFKVQSVLWMSFWLLATYFIFTTVVGSVTIIFFEKSAYDIDVRAYGIVMIVLTLSSRTGFSWYRLKKISTGVSFSNSVDYIFSGAFLLFSILSSRSHGSALIVLFCYSVFLFCAIIIASIINSLSMEKLNTEVTILNLKKTIQSILEDNLDRTFTSNELVAELRDRYNEKNSLISNTVVEDVVSEMDYETTDDEPVATICDWDYVIARWNSEIERKLITGCPTFLISDPNIQKNHSTNYILQDDLDKNFEKYLPYINERSKLSYRLMNFNKPTVVKILLKYYDQVITCKIKSQPRSSYLETYNIYFNQQSLNKYKTSILSNIMKLDIHAYDEIFNSTREKCQHLIHSDVDYKLFQLINGCIHSRLIDERLSLSCLFPISEDDILSKLHTKKPIASYDITKDLINLFSDNLPYNISDKWLWRETIIPEYVKEKTTDLFIQLQENGKIIESPLSDNNDRKITAFIRARKKR